MELDISIRSIDNGYIVNLNIPEDAQQLGVAGTEEEEVYFSSIESAYQYVIVKLYKLKDGEQPDMDLETFLNSQADDKPDDKS